MDSFQKGGIDENSGFQVVLLYKKASFLPWVFYCLEVSLTEHVQMEP